jgi:hypothetical protein
MNMEIGTEAAHFLFCEYFVSKFLYSFFAVHGGGLEAEQFALRIKKSGPPFSNPVDPALEVGCPSKLVSIRNNRNWNRN